MPQLDKYIFLNQIIYLTFFFFLIYMHVRKDVVPRVSTVLKYRKKRVHLFVKQLDGYSKILGYARFLNDKNGKLHTTFVASSISKMNVSMVEVNEKISTRSYIISRYLFNFVQN
jgi:hypothetical protein